MNVCMSVCMMYEYDSGKGKDWLDPSLNRIKTIDKEKMVTQPNRLSKASMQTEKKKEITPTRYAILETGVQIQGDEH